ncbi:Uu.00g042690.m01.CDS01 [Anthostomella pinea]|uniref:Uu.00g042690.m01.CDS01 n=1 Tax=Anthostomella pinea TaxID=933095 RepID=A0AAI8VBM7_9PEZI|nr:Uu.00g042690.m01.CDS01 [Anthostomella pinea]
MPRQWDHHDSNDPVDDVVTRFRHLGGDHGPSDPAYWDFDDEKDWDSDDSFSQVPPEIYESFEKTQAKYPRNSQDEVSRTPAGPMISLHDTRYFVPQWDEQMLGPAWRKERGAWDFDNPPKPLLPDDPKMKDAFRYCEEHPMHYAWAPGPDDIDIYRCDIESESSIVVHVRGGCVDDGQTVGPLHNRGSTGVFSGKDSEYNFASPQGVLNKPLDEEKAALDAALLALTVVRFDVLKDRRQLLDKTDNGGAGETAKQEMSKTSTKPTPAPSKNASPADADSDSSSEDDEDDSLALRIIIVSDNAAMVDNICKHQDTWDWEQEVPHTADGQPVKYGSLYERIEEMADGLEEDHDVVVNWYCVPEKFNKHAADLANEALRRNFKDVKQSFISAE